MRSPDYATPCPVCGLVLRAHTPIGEDKSPPVPGDLSVCFYCGLLLEFTEDLRLRVARQAVLEALSAETLTALHRAIAVTRLFHGFHGRPAD
jgi:hypothetical protein